MTLQNLLPQKQQESNESLELKRKELLAANKAAATSVLLALQTRFSQEVSRVEVCTQKISY